MCALKEVRQASGDPVLRIAIFKMHPGELWDSVEEDQE